MLTRLKFESCFALFVSFFHIYGDLLYCYFFNIINIYNVIYISHCNQKCDASCTPLGDGGRLGPDSSRRRIKPDDGT